MSKILSALAFLMFFCGAAFGQGVIVPRDCMNCPRPPIPGPRPFPRTLKVKSVNITTRIQAQVATTKVVQVFENESPYRLEGSYFFPIPESATISEFAIYDGDKRMAAEVVERQKARQIYDEIVRKMIDPGLLEYAGKDLFQASVFPIEPRSTRKIELAYTQVLKNEGGTVAYRYELGSGRRMLTQPIGQIAASVEIDSPISLKNIYSPSHQIAMNRRGEGRATLSFEGTGAEAQKDFLLYYSLSDKDFGLSLLSHKEPGKDGYFLMLVSPKVEFADRERLAKDVIFVFDTSGSMSGEKMEKAKAALRFGVESLSNRDRFNVISFSGEEHLMKTGLTEATAQAKQEARSFIDDLKAEGGTNINDAVVAALKQFGGAERPSMVVFLTDGLPTVGTTDVPQIIKNISAANRANVRIFSFGVGYDVNTSLLDKISAENKGTSDYIEPKEDLEVKVSNFFSKVNYPVLSDVKLEFGGAQTDLVYPRAIPDLFKGSQLTLIGRYKNGVEKATVRLTGRSGDRTVSLEFPNQSFASDRTSNGFLPRLWATRRVGYLLEQIRLNGANQELRDEIVALGTRFGIVTPYTSFLVTEDMKDVAAMPTAPPAASPGRRKALSGMDRNNFEFGRLQTGEAAVKQSQIEREMKASDSVDVPDQYLSNVRTAAGKTFILKDGVWVDTDYKAETSLPRVKVKFGSEPFFNLLSKQPQLSEFFSLGQKVVVVLNGTVYEVE